MNIKINGVPRGRDIQVPQYNHNADSVMLTFARVYNDVDLSRLTAKILLEGLDIIQAGLTDILRMETEEDTVTLIWRIQGRDTQQEGSFKAQAVFEDGEHVVYAQGFRLIVNRSVGVSEVVSDSSISLLEQYLDQFNKIKAEVEQTAGETASYAQTAENAAQTAQKAVGGFTDTVSEAENTILRAGTAQVDRVVKEGTQYVKKAQEAADQAAGYAETVKETVEGFTDMVDETVQKAVEDFTNTVDETVQKAVEDVTDAGTACVEQVKTAGADQIEAITSAGGDYIRKDMVEQSGLAVVSEAQGSTVVLTDSAEWRMQGLALYGHSKQVRTTGAQLLNQKLLLDFDSPNYNKQYGGMGLWYYKFPVSNTVTVSVARINKSGEYLKVSANPDGSNGTWLSHSTSANTSKVTITPKDGNIYFGVNNIPEKIESLLTNIGGIMVNEGSAVIEYEPYTGGKPSPSPEYPQEIENVGQDGDVKVQITGKSMIDAKMYAELNSNYEHIKILEDGFELDDSDGRPWIELPDLISLQAGKTYTVIMDVSGSINLRYVLNGKVYTVYGSSRDATRHSFVSNYTGFVKFKIDNHATIYPFTVSKFMICEGHTNDYEPYKPPQSLIVSTPNGLPGIPVKSGGNYTDATGQQWAADEIDCENQERIQRIGEYSFTGDESWNTWGVNNMTEGITGFYWYFKDEIASKFEEVKNTHTEYVANVHGGKNKGTKINTSDKYLMWSVGNESLENISDKESVIQSFKTLLRRINAKMLYVLETPIRTPLSPDEIKQFEALHTYRPTTVITNDAGAWMEAAYVADTKSYIDQKLEKMNQMLASTQAHLL